MNKILSNDLNEHLEKEKLETKSCCHFFTIKNGVHLIGGLVYLALLQGVIIISICEAVSVSIAIGCISFLLPQFLAFIIYVKFYITKDSLKSRKALKWAYFWMKISLLIEALWIPISILKMNDLEVANASGALGESLRGDPKGFAIAFLVIFLCLFVLATGLSYHYMRVLNKYAS